MSIGERIAKAIAPQAVTLTNEHTARLRASCDFFRTRCRQLEKENRRLRKQVEKLIGMMANQDRQS